MAAFLSAMAAFVGGAVRRGVQRVAAHISNGSEEARAAKRCKTAAAVKKTKKKKPMNANAFIDDEASGPEGDSVDGDGGGGSECDGSENVSDLVKGSNEDSSESNRESSSDDVGGRAGAGGGEGGGPRGVRRRPPPSPFLVAPRRKRRVVVSDSSADGEDEGGAGRGDDGPGGDGGAEEEEAISGRGKCPSVVRKMVVTSDSDEDEGADGADDEEEVDGSDDMDVVSAAAPGLGKRRRENEEEGGGTAGGVETGGRIELKYTTPTGGGRELRVAEKTDWRSAIITSRHTRWATNKRWWNVTMDDDGKKLVYDLGVGGATWRLEPAESAGPSVEELLGEPLSASALLKGLKTAYMEKLLDKLRGRERGGLPPLYRRVWDIWRPTEPGRFRLKNTCRAVYDAWGIAWEQAKQRVKDQLRMSTPARTAVVKNAQAKWSKTPEGIKNQQARGERNYEERKQDEPCPYCHCRTAFCWDGSSADGADDDTWCPCGLEAAHTDISGTPLAARLPRVLVGVFTRVLGAVCDPSRWPRLFARRSTRATSKSKEGESEEGLPHPDAPRILECHLRLNLAVYHHGLARDAARSPASRAASLACAVASITKACVKYGLVTAGADGEGARLLDNPAAVFPDAATGYFPFGKVGHLAPLLAVYGAVVLADLSVVATAASSSSSSSDRRSRIDQERLRDALRALERALCVDPLLLQLCRTAPNTWAALAKGREGLRGSLAFGREQSSLVLAQTAAHATTARAAPATEPHEATRGGDAAEHDPASGRATNVVLEMMRLQARSAAVAAESAVIVDRIASFLVCPACEVTRQYLDTGRRPRGALVGAVVEVYRAVDDTWHRGTVTRWDGRVDRRLHCVAYDTGVDAPVDEWCPDLSALPLAQVRELPPCGRSVAGWLSSKGQCVRPLGGREVVSSSTLLGCHRPIARSMRNGALAEEVARRHPYAGATGLHQLPVSRGGVGDVADDSTSDTEADDDEEEKEVGPGLVFPTDDDLERSRPFSDNRASLHWTECHVLAQARSSDVEEIRRLVDKARTAAEAGSRDVQPWAFEVAFTPLHGDRIGDGAGAPELSLYPVSFRLELGEVEKERRGPSATTLNPISSAAAQGCLAAYATDVNPEKMERSGACACCGVMVSTTDDTRLWDLRPPESTALVDKLFLHRNVCFQGVPAMYRTPVPADELVDAMERLPLSGLHGAEKERYRNVPPGSTLDAWLGDYV